MELKEPTEAIADEDMGNDKDNPPIDRPSGHMHSDCSSDLP